MRLGIFLTAATLLSVAACAPYPPPGPTVAYVPAPTSSPPADGSGTTPPPSGQPVAAPVYAYGYWGGPYYGADPWCYWDDWCGWDPWWGWGFGGFAFIGHFHRHPHFHHSFVHHGFAHHR
jgi:hypothetical protein